MMENKQNSETEKANTTGEKPMTDGSATAAKKAPNNFEDKQNLAGAENDGSIKEAVGQAATQVAGQAKEKAVSLIGEQKTNLATGINSVADSIRQIGENLQNDGEHNQIASLAGKYGDSLAGQVERFSQYVEESDLKEVARDVEQFARRNPAFFIGGAFAVGVLAARFLKSSGSGQKSARRLNNNSTGNDLARGVSTSADAAVQAS